MFVITSKHGIKNFSVTVIIFKDLLIKNIKIELIKKHNNHH